MIKQRGAGFDDDGKVHPGRNSGPMKPKILTNPTFDTIATDSIADLAANADAQTGAKGTGTCNHEEMGSMTPPSLPPDLRILARSPQAAA